MNGVSWTFLIRERLIRGFVIWIYLRSDTMSRNRMSFSLVTGKDFTLLTPEALWYPVSKPVTELMNPYVNTSEYTDYTLTVVPAQGNTVVSQGKLTVSGDTSYFANNRKLQGITLLSGQFLLRLVSTCG